MKPRIGILVGLLLGIVWVPASSRALGLPAGAGELNGQTAGQAFAGSGTLTGVAGATGALAADPAAFDAPDSGQFAEATRAINESRWADAVRLFGGVAAQHGEHADGALYWKAYAEDKLGQSKPSMGACTELQSSYPHSRWIDDCSALEIEIRAKLGKPVKIEPGQSDDVKLLALNAMLHQDEPRALAEIQAILNGDASERLKKQAQLMLGKHYSDLTFAQVVRVSYVEGDVRIERGGQTGKPDGEGWEKAVANLPLETGFSLVTGAGRAEIEFENASTLYLGENSVLTFNDLHTTAGVPYTELGLLSGTVSLHVRPYVAGERFILHLPTNDLATKYPDKFYVRVRSFTDAVTITPLQGLDMHLAGVPNNVIKPGRTWTYVQGQLWADEEPEDTTSFAVWDKWVGERVARREAATAAVMEDAGLAEPIPGLAELEGQGRFFDCPPYGTCWEPNRDAEEDDVLLRQPRQQGSSQPRFELAAYSPAPRMSWVSQAAGDTGPEIQRHDIGFPCMPGALIYRTVKDPATGKQRVIDQGFGPAEPYDWAVCHAGSWIRHRRHYVWVAGGKRRHIPPVRWIKSGHRLAFVPLHPYDVRGLPAINVRHEVFEVTGKGAIEVQPVRFETNLPIEYLKDPPKEYRVEPLRPLPLAEVPHMEAHSFARAAGAKSTDTSKAGIPIHFDTRSQSFMMERQEVRSGRSATVLAPITNHSGSLQARGSSFAGSSGVHGGSTGGGGSHAGSSGSSGGSHGGGGSVSASSGGSHSSSSSSVSSASSASSSSVSAGSSSHH